MFLLILEMLCRFVRLLVSIFDLFWDLLNALYRHALKVRAILGDDGGRRFPVSTLAPHVMLGALTIKRAVCARHEQAIASGRPLALSRLTAACPASLRARDRPPAEFSKNCLRVWKACTSFVIDTTGNTESTAYPLPIMSVSRALPILDCFEI